MNLADDPTFQTHCKRRSLAAVTKLYDGKHDVATIAEAYQAVKGTPAPPATVPAAVTETPEEKEAEKALSFYNREIVTEWIDDAVPCSPTHFRDHMTEMEVDIQVQRINRIAQNAIEAIAPLAAELKHNKNWKSGTDKDGNAYHSWDAFCKDKFRLSRVETDRKIDAYIGASKLPPRLLSAFKESHLRAFSDMPDDQARVVAKAVLDEAKANPGPFSLGITAAKIENKQRELFPSDKSVLRDTVTQTKESKEKSLQGREAGDESRLQSGNITVSTPNDVDEADHTDVDTFGMIPGEALADSLARMHDWAVQAVKTEAMRGDACRLLAGATQYLLTQLRSA